MVLYLAIKWKASPVRFPELVEEVGVVGGDEVLECEGRNGGDREHVGVEEKVLMFFWATSLLYWAAETARILGRGWGGGGGLALGAWVFMDPWLDICFPGYGGRGVTVGGKPGVAIVRRQLLRQCQDGKDSV